MLCYIIINGTKKDEQIFLLVFFYFCLGFAETYKTNQAHEIIHSLTSGEKQCIGGLGLYQGVPNLESVRAILAIECAKIDNKTFKSTFHQC